MDLKAYHCFKLCYQLIDIPTVSSYKAQSMVIALGIDRDRAP